MRFTRTQLVAGATTLMFAAGVAIAGTASAADPVAPITQACVDENTGFQTQLEIHAGFQDGPRCVAIEMGEMTELAKNPTLAIIDAPEKVEPGDDFTIKVSTRNLIRDRFLAAAQGGYYHEAAVLDPATGLTRGHFHTGCEVIEPNRRTKLRVAPEPTRSLVFQATEDKKGGAEPDVVAVTFKGKDANGNDVFKDGQTIRCASWAGDGSHRTPMMQFANEIPAIDAVRIKVRM